MKIVHVCAASGVYDGWNYQENMLSKYHKQLGLDVTIVTSQIVRGKDGKVELNTNREYINPDGVKMIRLPLVGSNKPKKFRKLSGFKKVLGKENPDIIFIHNCQFLNYGDIISFAKRKHVKIYMDNHADFSNSASGFISKKILHGVIWRHQVHRIEPYVTKFYGVLPARVDFLKNVYRTPEQKTELLVMGGDEELIKEAEHPEVKKKVRNELCVSNETFLLATGGKIDKYKWETLNLLKAMSELVSYDIHLVIFGSVNEDLKDQFIKLCSSSNVTYIGWIDSKESYRYFSAADLVVFPGRHSVFWEQVAAQGKPLICKYWEGTTHVDSGGNVIFLKENTVEELKKTILEIYDNKDRYNSMISNARNNAKRFYYSRIAAQSIGMDIDYES